MARDSEMFTVNVLVVDNMTPRTCLRHITILFRDVKHATSEFKFKMTRRFLED